MHHWYAVGKVERRIMAFVPKLIAVAALLVTPGLALYGYYNAGSSPDAWALRGSQSSGGGGGEIHAAPDPIAGAGLPILIVAGGYWIVRRLRRKAN